MDVQPHATAACEGFEDHVFEIHLAGALLVWVALAQFTVKIMTSRVPVQFYASVHISCY